MQGLVSLRRFGGLLALGACLAFGACGKPEKPAQANAPATAPEPAAETPLSQRSWSNITGGIGVSLKFAGDGGVLVDCETGGYCTAYRVEGVKWDGSAVALDVRYPDNVQRWRARVDSEGALQIEGGIWRPQTLFRCDAAPKIEVAPPYLCPESVPPPEPRGSEFKGKLVQGPGSPVWSGITEWPAGTTEILWGSEANGGDPCSPVLVPPADAPDGWTRFWTWRVYSPDALTETAILLRVVKMGGGVTSDISVVRRRQLSAWKAGGFDLDGVFLSYYPTAPGGIHSYFRAYGLQPGKDGKPALMRTYSFLGRGGEAVDSLEALRRYQKSSPMEVSEYKEVGIRATEDVDTACSPKDLGVLGNLKYRLKDVADGRVEYGMVGYLVADLTNSHPN